MRIEIPVFDGFDEIDVFGPFEVLSSAGLLAERYATTNGNAFDELRPHVLDVIAERVVDDGDRLTAGGLTAGLDLGLWIVERELGSAVADRVADSIEYPRQGRVWRAPPRVH